MWAVAPAGIGFVGSGLGPDYAGDLFVGESRTFLDNGYLFELQVRPGPQHFAFTDPALADKVDDNDYKFDAGESKSLLAGMNFGIVTDIETGPDGNLYVTSLSNGAVYMISAKNVPPTPPPTPAPLQVFGTAFVATAGRAVRSTVATLTDSVPGLGARDVTAVIDWGDGSRTTPGRVRKEGQGVFSVTGRHLYRSPGNFEVTVVIDDHQGNVTTAHSTAVVARRGRRPRGRGASVSPLVLRSRSPVAMDLVHDAALREIAFASSGRRHA